MEPGFKNHDTSSMCDLIQYLDTGRFPKWFLFGSPCNQNRSILWAVLWPFAESSIFGYLDPLPKAPTHPNMDYLNMASVSGIGILVCGIYFIFEYMDPPWFGAGDYQELLGRAQHQAAVGCAPARRGALSCEPTSFEELL